MNLTRQFINQAGKKIEKAILPAMEKIYLHDREVFDDSFCPGLKESEKIVSYFDYLPCGISVLAKMKADGNNRASKLLEKIKNNIACYKKKVFMKYEPQPGNIWKIPLRRLIFHIALAYRHMESILSENEKQWFRDLIEEEVPLAIKYNRDFFAGANDFHANNHTAIFMQGIYHCGKVFDHPEWTKQMVEFAERLLASGHKDGYFEEHANDDREGGPSLVYSRLTAGALFDVLDGKKNHKERFLKCGEFYRRFFNHNYDFIPIADERTNVNKYFMDYGLALHSLSPEGRYYLVEAINSANIDKMHSESLAVLYYELGLMEEGEGALPENRQEGNSRLTLPLGVVRKNGFTAGISALKALNRMYPCNDYALDQQNMIYLSHNKAGVISPGIKSKNDPLFSTFRVGDDAYTVKTGALKMGEGWAEAHLHYETFVIKMRWDIGQTAVLTCTEESARHVTTSILVTDEKHVNSNVPFEIKILQGFSPYTQANKSDQHKALVFEWTGELKVEFFT